MTRFLLDTNIVSDMIRQPRGLVAQRIAEVGEAAVCTSIVVAAELWYGAEKKASAALAARVDAVLQVLPVLPFDAPADAAYGVLRARLERAGRIIGGNDMLIAAQAIAGNLVLVTDNLDEFQRVSGLRCETWLR